MVLTWDPAAQRLSWREQSGLSSNASLGAATCRQMASESGLRLLLGGAPSARRSRRHQKADKATVSARRRTRAESWHQLVDRVMMNIGHPKARSISKATLLRYGAWEAQVVSFAPAHSLPLTDANQVDSALASYA